MARGEVEIPELALHVATVGRPHGVKGELRLMPESRRPERLLGVRRLWLRAADGRVTALGVLSMRSHGGAALAVLEGIRDRDEAAAWTHAEAWALAAELPAW